MKRTVRIGSLFFFVWLLWSGGAYFLSKVLSAEFHLFAFSLSGLVLALVFVYSRSNEIQSRKEEKEDWLRIATQGTLTKLLSGILAVVALYFYDSSLLPSGSIYILGLFFLLSCTDLILILRIDQKV